VSGDVPGPDPYVTYRMNSNLHSSCTFACVHESRCADRSLYMLYTDTYCLPVKSSKLYCFCLDGRPRPSKCATKVWGLRFTRDGKHLADAGAVYANRRKYGEITESWIVDMYS